MKPKEVVVFINVAVLTIFFCFTKGFYKSTKHCSLTHNEEASLTSLAEPQKELCTVPVAFSFTHMKNAALQIVYFKLHFTCCEDLCTSAMKYVLIWKLSIHQRWNYLALFQKKSIRNILLEGVRREIQVGLASMSLWRCQR